MTVRAKRKWVIREKENPNSLEFRPITIILQFAQTLRTLNADDVGLISSKQDLLKGTSIDPTSARIRSAGSPTARRLPLNSVGRIASGFLFLSATFD